MKFPILEEVEQASHEQLCRWYRFLLPARNTEELEIIKKISERLDAFGGMTAEISKKIGW